MFDTYVPNPFVTPLVPTWDLFFQSSLVNSAALAVLLVTIMAAIVCATLDRTGH